MAEKQDDVFLMHQWFEDNDLTFHKVDDKGDPIVINSDGEEQSISLFKDLGINPKNTIVEYNTELDPIETSPLTIEERLQMSLGNTKGNTAKLKSKFGKDNVKVHPDKGLIVKSKNAWHTVDPPALGNDPWEMTSELVKDAADLASVAIDVPIQTAGAIGGTLLGGPAGGVAGSAVASGVSSAIKTSLGRLVGTYRATPEEQLQDIAFESLLGTGGQLVGLGAKPALSQIAKAAGKIKRSATPVAKDALSSLYGTLTGTGKEATEELLENAPKVVGNMQRAIKQAGPQGRVSDVQGIIRDRQINLSRQFLKQARPSISKKYGKMEADLVSRVPNNMEFDVGNLVNNTQNQLASMGLGKFRPDPKDATKEVFEFISQREMQAAIDSGDIPKTISKEALEAVKAFSDEVALFSRFPKIKGKEGAKKLLQVKKRLSEAASSINEELNPVAKRALTDISQPLNDSFASSFRNSNINPQLANDLGNRYAEAATFYSQNIGNVLEAERLLGLPSKAGPEQFVKKLIADPLNNRTARAQAKQLEELVGLKGTDFTKNIRSLEASLRYTPRMPQLQKLGTIGAVGGIVAGEAAEAIPKQATGFLTASLSPRGVARQMQAASVLLNTVRGMNEKTLTKFLADEKTVQAMARSFATNMPEEEALKNAIFQEAAVNPNIKLGE